MNRDAAHTSIVRTSDFIAVVAMVGGAALEYLLFGTMDLPVTGAVRIPAGIVVLAAGAALIVAARRALARADQPSKPGVATTDLVTAGVFAYTRNPTYLGLAVVILGLGLAANVVAWVALSVPAAIAMHYALVLPEERYLKETFPEAFAAYASRFRRWI